MGMSLLSVSFVRIISVTQGPGYISHTAEMTFQLFPAIVDLGNIGVYVFIYNLKIYSYMEIYLSSTYSLC